MQRMNCALLGLVALGLPASAIAQTCEPSATRHAERITPNRPGASSFPVVYGKNRFTQTLNNGWMFSLLPSQYGWNMQLTDQSVDAPGTVDMSAITPPYGSVPPNPRDISGWHFRNADNSGPNKGEVNAPQALRLFIFNDALIGTGGFRPPRGSDGSGREPSENEGRGWLLVKDYGLADLGKGERARMNYMEFDACVTWPKTEEEQRDEADAASPIYVSEEKELMARCGLDLQTYEMKATMLPRWVGGDIDGDDAGDEVVQVVRRSDGQRGLAFCRASTWMDVIGIAQPFAEETALKVLPRAGSWTWVPKAQGQGAYDYLDPSVWPADAEGDVLVLEMIEKQAYAVYWKEGRLRTKKLFHIVTE